jgi:hypothetical protein
MHYKISSQMLCFNVDLGDYLYTGPFSFFILILFEKKCVFSLSFSIDKAIEISYYLNTNNDSAAFT